MIVEKGRTFYNIYSLFGVGQHQRSRNIYIVAEKQGLEGLFLFRRQLEQIG